MSNTESMIESATLTADVTKIFREYAKENDIELVIPESVARTSLLLHHRRTVQETFTEPYVTADHERWPTVKEGEEPRFADHHDDY